MNQNNTILLEKHKDIPDNPVLPECLDYDSMEHEADHHTGMDTGELAVLIRN